MHAGTIFLCEITDRFTDLQRVIESTSYMEVRQHEC